MRIRTVMLAGIVVLAACSESTGSEAIFAPQFAGKGKPTGPVDPTATWTISDAPGLGLQSDGGGAYVNGGCAVSTRIFATSAGSNSGDATVQMDAARGKGCGRRVRLIYPSGESELVRVFMNLRDLHNALDLSTGTYTSIPIGATELRTFAVRSDIINESSRCGRVLFGLGDQGAGVGTDKVQVHRVSRNEFHVFSQDGATKALCESEGSIIEMRVDLTITADSDLP